MTLEKRVVRVGGVSHDFPYLVFDPGGILVCYGGANDPLCRSHNLLDSPLFDVAENKPYRDGGCDYGFRLALGFEG